MLKKLAVSLGVFAMAFGVFFGSEAYANHDSTHFGPASWRTEDGKYELTVKTTSYYKNVQINVWDLLMVDSSTGQQYVGYGDDLIVRLCSASTGNCTAFKSFVEYPTIDGLWIAGFSNMIPATYYVDIRDNRSGYYYKGMIDADLYPY